MRFEQLGHSGKIKTLERLHRHINRRLFEGALAEIHVDIQNIGDMDGIHRVYPESCREFFPEEEILISVDLVGDLSRLKTQKEQVLRLGIVMLHEMIHQFCYENGIEDRQHGENWILEAREHGLISDYRDGEPKREQLDLSGYICLQEFRIKAV